MPGWPSIDRDAARRSDQTAAGRTDAAAARQSDDARAKGAESAAPSLSIVRDGVRTTLVFSGRLDAPGAGILWTQAMRAVTRVRGAPLRFDLAAVPALDMAGAALLLSAERRHGQPAEIVGADQQVAAVLARAQLATASSTQPAATPASASPSLSAAIIDALANGVAFVGEATVAVLHLPTRHRMLRIGDLLRYADQAGVRAVPLVMLLGFLMGMILAFQSAVPMRRFGADLFVANLVTISLLRELGPLLSAVILAGRTGSAFAAEIGTMKVNQEIDALVTMGIDPMTILVLPRLIAVMLVLPALALALDIAGLIGMATVLRGFGFPMVTIVHQVQSAASVSYLFGGLFKAVCFGAAIAAIGCRAGLSTGNGPRAVGLSATAAVVGGIISTIALDGVLALIFYRLNL
jgi:phospholipid/cholesterol/gamma-HCH transport system permease protein